MHIHAHMSLHGLAERMGDIATETEARIMRDLLTEYYDGMDTSDVPESEWLMALEMSHEIFLRRLHVSMAPAGVTGRRY